MGIPFRNRLEFGLPGRFRRFWAHLTFDRTDELSPVGVPNRLPILRTIIWCSFICVAAAVTLIGLTVWTLRSDAISDASTDTGNIATVLAEQTSRSVQAVDLVLTEIDDHLRRAGIVSADDFRTGLNDKETFQFLRDRLSRLQADVVTRW
jgi:hypothetical protein